MKSKKTKTYTMKPLETIIERNGYEYTLVEVDRPKEWGCPQPKFMGIPNMALKCCKKIIKVKK